MRKFSTVTLAAGAALVVLTPSVASAQNTTVADPTYAAPVDDNDDEFPLGLLGLLGLAGLLGLRRRDNHVHHDTTTRTR